jgi:probable F420-dependent oxidoreductase
VTQPLRVGIQLPEVEREVRWPEVAAMARAAEEAGFDSVWLGDHLLYRGDGRPERGPWDVWTQLAALAAATSRVRLGPLVACTAFHPPGLLARMAGSVDEVSGGRLVLGIGAGWNQAEFDAFGIPYDRRVSRFEEAFGIVRRLLAGERVTFSGRFHAVEDAVLLPPPRRRVPLMVGTTGERMLSITLPHVDAWNTWFDEFGNDPARFSELNAQIDRAAERAGRDPQEVERSACLLVTVDPSSQERPPLPDAPALPVDALRSALRTLAEAGADEAILVASPITEASIQELGAALEG